MISTIEIEKRLQVLKPVLADRFHVSKIGYFGSYSTGRQTEQSDIDLLVELEKPIGWKFFSLELYLEKIFNRKIDLVTRNALKEQIKDRILKQIKYA